MYKHLLITTDGSRLAARGIKAGIGLAKGLGARVTGVYVASPSLPPIYGEAAVYYVESFSRTEYKKLTQDMAKKPLGEIERAARVAGVRCVTRLVFDSRPWHGILRTARAQKCDAIVMASHGRSAVSGLILGSETTRVLAHSKIPVIVAR